MRGNGSITRSKGTSGPGMPSDQPTTRKKGFVDWMNFLKPTSEEKDHWHHCWNCGDIFCDKCIHVELSSLQMSMLSQYESVTDAWISWTKVMRHQQVQTSKSSDGSGRRMREVACPACTVILQDHPLGKHGKHK
ncbi:protein FREE1 isoform X2 [Elaeis guineensis]